MSIVYTNTGRRLLRKAQSLWVLPYVYNSSLNDYVLGQTVYDLSAIIGDSITLEQQDGDARTKTNEFTNEPLVKNISAGECQFTAQCLDLQNAVLKSLFAAYFNDSYGIAALRKDFPTLYAYIRIRFNNTAVPDVILPQVLLNSKLLLQQMSSRGSQGNLSGLALSRKCAFIKTSATSLRAGVLHPLSDQINGTTSYEIESSVLFVPQAMELLVLNSQDDESGYRKYDQPLKTVSENQDCCAHNRYIRDSSPSNYYLSAV